MSKGAGKAEVFRTTKVRTRLRDDGSWLQRRSEPDDEKEEEEAKPWLAEVRASRVNGAPIETSPVSSPTKATPPPTNSETQSAPKPGYLIRGVFTKLDNPPVNSPSTNGTSGTTQFTKKPSETYKKIAPYTVKPTLESQESQLSPEEQEKRTEAASNVLKNSAGRQRSYVLSAAKKFETKAEEPSPVNNSLAFVAKRVEITDDEERAATLAPASSPSPSSVAPVTSVASAPKPKLWTPLDPGVKKAVEATVNKPVAPKVEEKEAAPEPAKEDPQPVSVKEKDPFEDMKPGCTKVATPLPEYIPEPEDLKYAVQDETPLVDLTPADVPLLPTPLSPTSPAVPLSPTPVSPPPAPAVPLSPTPMSPTPAPAVPLSPTPLSPTPAPAVPLSPTPVSPTPAPKIPLSPTPVSPTPAPKVPLSPTPVSPTPAPAVPLSPTPVSPTPAPKVPLSPTPMSPTPAPAVPLSPTPVSPTPAPAVPLSPTPVSPVPFSPFPVSSVTAVTVKTKQDPEPEPSPKPSSTVDTLSTLSDTLISFNTSSSSLKDNEPDLAKEEGDTHTAEEGDEEEPTPAISNSIPSTDDLLSLIEGPGESTEPVPPSPGRWSQYLLSGPDSESKPAKSNGTLDLLANDVIIRNSEARSLSTQPEEEKPADETAKETQSSTETVTVTTKTVIITDKSEEDSTGPWSSRVKTTTVTESRSADPFDPYPIGTTSPNSSSDLLQPLSDISINRVSTTFTEDKDPSEDTPASSNALESLADDVIPINTEVKSLSTRRSWTSTWDTSTTRQTYTEERDEAKPEGQAEDQNTTIMFERKSKENDSPWDRWTSPTVYTYSTGQDDEEEESHEDTQTKTVTTITTLRETYSEPEPAMDRYDTYSRTVIDEERRVQTPEPATKKGFVYLKEYVNTSELSLHNARDTADGGSDYLTSRSANYSYSSPSSGTPSSICNFCGKQVGNDAKISIEHLNINCHPACFKCGVCDKPMGDLLFSMFLHEGKVHCESCYSTALD